MLKWIGSKLITILKNILIIILAFIVVELLLVIAGSLGPQPSHHTGEIHPFVAIAMAPIYLLELLWALIVNLLLIGGIIGISTYFIIKNKKKKQIQKQ